MTSEIPLRLQKVLGIPHHLADLIAPYVDDLLQLPLQEVALRAEDLSDEKRPRVRGVPLDLQTLFELFYGDVSVQDGDPTEQVFFETGHSFVDRIPGGSRELKSSVKHTMRSPRRTTRFQ